MIIGPVLLGFWASIVFIAFIVIGFLDLWSFILSLYFKTYVVIYILDVILYYGFPTWMLTFKYLLDFDPRLKSAGLLDYIII